MEKRDKRKMQQNDFHNIYKDLFITCQKRGFSHITVFALKCIKCSGAIRYFMILKDIILPVQFVFVLQSTLDLGSFPMIFSRAFVSFPRSEHSGFALSIAKTWPSIGT